MYKKIYRVLSLILAILIALNSFQLTMGTKVQAAGDTFNATTGTLTLNGSFAAGGLKAQIDAVINPLGKGYSDIKALIVTAGVVGVGKTADGGSDITGIIPSLTALVDFQMIGTSAVQSSSTAPGDNVVLKNFFTTANAQLKSVTLQNATTINAQAFQNLSSLTTLVIPKVTTIASTNAFTGDNSLTSITLGATPPTLTSGTITALLSNLAAGAIFYVPAANLATYQATAPWSTIPTRISAIPSGGGGSSGTFDAATGTLTLTGAFAVSTLKTQIDAVLPSGKTYADIKVLKITAGIVGVDDTTNIIPLLTNLQDFQMTGTAATQSTTVANSVYTVQANFFTQTNAQLTTVTLQNAKTLNAQAFQNCSCMTTLIVPSLINVVDVSAFSGTNLTSITLGPSIPTSGPAFFPANVTFFVPAGSLSAYKTAWSSAASRIKAIGDPPDNTQGSFDAATGTLTLTGAFAVNTLKAEIDAVINPLSKAYTDIKDLVITNGIVGSTDATGTIPLLTNLQDLQIVGNATTQSSSNSSTKNTTPKNLASGTANSKLRSVTLNNVTTLGTTTFSGVDSLTNLVIPMVTVVADAKVFQNVTNLTSITLGATPPTSGAGFFPANATFFVPADKVAAYKTDAVMGAIANPIKAIGEALDYIQGFEATTGTLTLTGAFAVGSLKAQIDAIINPLNKQYSDIKVLKVSAGTIGIDDVAATGVMPQLINLEDLQLIGSATTQGTSNSNTVGSSPKNLVSSANSKLKSVTLKNVTTIGTSTFSGSASLSTLVIPSVTTVTNADAFTGCTKLTSITFGATPPPATAGPNLFPAIATFYVPVDKVAAYKGDAVWSSVASRIKAIGDTSGGEPPVTDGNAVITFNTTGSLLDLLAAAGYDSTDSTQAASLKTIVIKAGGAKKVFANSDFNPTTGKSFSNYINLTTFTIEKPEDPSYLTWNGNKLPNNSFKGLAKLKQVKIGIDTSYIGTSAFEGCISLETAEFGLTRALGPWAFKGDTNLKSITFNKTYLPIGLDDYVGPPEAQGDWFYGVNTDNLIIYVPTVAVNAFLADADWSNIGDNGITIMSNGDNAAEDAGSGPPATQNVVVNTFTSKFLQSAIDSSNYSGNDYGDIRVLTINAGVLDPADCVFIATSLKKLEELYVVGTANFVDGVIPKNAYEGNKYLKKVKADNVTTIGAKAFNLFESLTEVNFPNVTRINTQAFAQTKGSSASKLTTAKFPKVQVIEQRAFYFCVNLTDLYLGSLPPKLDVPYGKQGLWFNFVTHMTVHVPSLAVYNEYLKLENSDQIDWSAMTFVADNGDALPIIPQAAPYVDADYNYLREDHPVPYYNGDYGISLNMYTFNMNLNSWLQGRTSPVPMTTLDTIQWAHDHGFDAVDVTCYYIPGYSNTDMPTPDQQVAIHAYAKQIKDLAGSLGIAISGTGIQNNFADPNQARRDVDIERIKFWTQIASEMGAPVIRIFAGPPPVDITRTGWAAITRDRITPAIQQVADFAAANFPTVQIGIQNHGDMLATANQVLQLVKWVNRSNVGVVNDTGYYRDFMNTDATHYDWYKDISLILPYSNNFQVKKKPAGAETTELMDLNKLFGTIRNSPYRGYIPVELLWLANDDGYPGKLNTPPYEETLAFLDSMKKAMRDTKHIISEDDITLSLKASHPNIVSVDENARSIQVIEKTSLEQLDAQTTNGAGTILRVLDANGIPKKEIAELVAGDKFVVIVGTSKKEYTIQVIHYTLENLALNPNASNIKVSSFRSGIDPANAFNGASTGNAGSGYQVDGSQSTASNISAGKNTFWLALDLGQMKKIDQFSVAWGTSVGDLTTRLKDSTYRIEYTNDPAKWAAISNATVAGSSGIATGYSKPAGWDLAYAQDVTQLPDANGNKVFMSNLASPINARYVMVTGELASNWIEIYNFYVFQKEVSNIVPTQPVYPTGDLARIVPDYEGMSLTVGRPAIVKKDKAVPKFHITAMENITVSGVMKDSSGATVYTLPSQNIASGATSVIAPNITASALGTYTFEFTISGSKTIYDKVYFTAVDDDITKYNYTKPYPAFSVNAGKLVYVPDYRGNSVMDYSNVGYKGGGVEIPNVPVKIILEPSEDSNSDDTERIQNAVNMLGRIDPDSSGFRGSILLKAGTYRVSSTIKISSSGIVLKGEGDDHGGIETHNTPLSPTNWKDYTHSEAPQPNVTKVVATWIASSYDKNTAVFNFAGAATSNSGSPIKVVDQYVPAGGHTIRLENVSGLSVGDTVNVRKAVNAAWAQDLKMDVMTDAPGILSANQWAVNGAVDSGYSTMDEERTIKSINPVTNEITLLEPLADALDMKYGVSTVTKYSPTGRINNVGIENMQIMSRFDASSTAINTAFGVDYMSYNDELHAELAVRFGNVQNAWARTITTYHIDSAVAIATGVSKITIQDVNCLEPVSGTGGERRYNFSNAGGTLVLNQRNYSRYTRHGFIVMGNVVGQNVFYNNRTDYQFDANEPHLRWSIGGLYDNFNGRIYLQDRWNNGTAHGWSGANYTLYNNTGYYIISQNQLAANYLFGQSGTRLPFVMDAVDPGNVPNFRAYEYSNGSKMTPGSLFIQQLKDRLGQGAVDKTNSSAIPVIIDQSGNFASQFATLTGIFVDGVPLANFNKEVLGYTVPVALDYTVLPAITYTADTGATVTTSVGGNNAVIFTVSVPGKTDSVYTVNYGIINKAVPVTSSAGVSTVNNLIDGITSTSWSSSGTPWVQFYLGDKPAFIDSVSLGYSRDTQIRRSYYFDFLVSNDGYTWTKVMASNWQQDNLGNGHIMGKEVMPGSDGDSASDYETFTFPANISGRLLRVAMYGARAGTGTGTSNANKYWAIDVGAAINGGLLTVSKQPQNAAKREGFTATYTVTVSGGTRPYNYQWKVSKDDGLTWNDAATGTGANTVTYTTGEITAAMDGYKYRSKVTDSDAGGPQTAYSNVATLTVKQDTGITVTPVDTSVSVFDNVIYSRSATIRNTSFVYGLLGYVDIKPAGSTVFVIPSNIAPRTESVAAFLDSIATYWPPDDDSLRDSKKSYIRKSGEQIRDGDHLLIINPAKTGVERYIINYAKMDDSTVVSADKSVLTFDRIKGQNTAADSITGNLILPTTSSYGSTISWKVENNTNLTAAGVVKRPLYVDGDAKVTLTATVASAAVIDTVIFNLTILKKGADEVPSNNAAVTAKGSSETGYLWGLTVDNASKTIAGLTASTSVDVFKNGITADQSARLKVVTSAVGSVVTAATFADAVETTKNVANGNLLIVLAEDGITLNKYTIALKPNAATPTAVAVPGKKYNTTKLTGLLAGTTYQYVIRTALGTPSASTWASSSVQFTTGANETEKDNLFVTQGSYLYIRAAETAAMSASSAMYILIDVSQINKTVDASAPAVALQPGSNHFTTKLTSLLSGTAYEYINNTSAQELDNWDAALLFTTAVGETTKDNIPVTTGQYLHIRFSATDSKDASSEKNIYMTADLVKVKPVNATPQSSALPGSLGGTTKLTGLLPNTTYRYIINTNNDNPATDAWEHKGQSIATGSGQTAYDNIVSSPELYIHLMAVENSSNANSLPQNYLVGAGGVKSLPQGVIPTASADPGTVGGTMKLTGLLPDTAYEFVVTDALSSPKNTTWGESIVSRTRTGAGETAIDNVEVPADLGNMHIRTGGTTTNSPSDAQNFIILNAYVNNAAGTLSNNAYVTAATSGVGYIPGIIVSGKAPNFTILNVPEGTTKEALKATLLRNSKAGWKVVANATVSATVKDTATFNNAREISTNVLNANVLTVLAEDGKTVQRYTISTIPATAVRVTGITVSKETLSIVKDSTQQLTATVSPTNAYNKDVSWSSSDENVATVDENGVVTAVAVGTVTIKATTVDGGFMAASMVTVLKNTSTPATPTEDGTANKAGTVQNANFNIIVNADTGATVTAKIGGMNVLQSGTGVMAASGKATLPIDLTKLSAGTNAIVIIATDATGNVSGALTVTVTRAARSNADLSDISLSSGSLNETFVPATTSYTQSVANNIVSLKLTPTVVDAAASVTVNGTTVTSGQPSAAIALNVGVNTITVVVTAADGSTKIYKIQVTRISSNSNALLSSMAVDQGTLTPAFSPANPNYSVELPNAASSIKLFLIKADPRATITVTGAVYNNVTGNVYSYTATNLIIGSNSIQMVVSAEDGTINRYHITVNRAPAVSSNANLSSLTLSSGTLSPAFVSGTTAYTSSVVNGVSSLTVTGNVENNNATMTVNGNPVTSDQASDMIKLNVGDNIITIVVTAQNGELKTYTIIINRAPEAARVTQPKSSGGNVGTIAIVTSTDGNLTVPTGKNGEVSLGDSVKISIPADASDKELKLTIEKVLDSQKLLTNQNILVSPIYEILKNFSENFSKPVTLDFAFDPASLMSNQRAAVFYYDEAKKVWVEVTGSKVNGDHITVEVDHFTKYAVFAVDQVTEKTATEQPAGTNPAVQLSDIAGHWAEISIKQAVSSGIVSGYPDGTFKPNHTVTRMEFAVMLVNTLKLQGEGAVLTFTDTMKIGTWAQKAVAQAFQAGIIKGYEDGTFRPGAEITRAEMAVMLANALGLALDADTTTGFADDKDVPEWAKGSVAAMKKQKLVEGRGADEFGPTALTTRAEAVKVLLNMQAQKSK
ncbi:leucine-rich repeat protein [Paenibacillus radicis (ex Xue et al. 2023)]|uniref:Leucine-rich repeat protein n=1 Tax=Paenibacillus radicis (ex Xue et al. 2023) TaxID=2972489 RepID=A0ABT1YCP3_9BACL|nr:leucine-rich repeat protein [Paenibacillus radicis (ex Xue et al. 2023)]MCR8630956.1 leucine-rich repeat protein [Paenibacillus radicis (ex Xue et al. 2023)]